MFLSEIDSFFCNIINLLHSVKNARLEIQSESGKATVNLTAEVEIPAKPCYQDRNGPALQRCYDGGAAARAEAVAAETAADIAAAAATKARAVTVADVINANYYSLGISWTINLCLK